MNDSKTYQSEKIKDTTNTYIDPSTKQNQDTLNNLVDNLSTLIETMQELSSRLAFLGGVRGASADLRVTPISLPTLGTVTTVGTLTNQTNIGGIPATGKINNIQNNIAIQSNINNVTA